MKVGDLIKHRYRYQYANLVGIVLEVSRNGPPGFPVYVAAHWGGDWFDGRSIEQQYLEVISVKK